MTELLQPTRQERIEKRRAYVSKKLAALSSDSDARATDLITLGELRSTTDPFAHRSQLAKAIIEALREGILRDSESVAELDAAKRAADAAAAWSTSQELTERHAELEAEAETSLAMQAQQWAALRSMQLPLHLSQAIDRQNALCTADFENSDALAETIWETLKRKDEEYVTLLHSESLGLEELLATMASQLGGFQAACQEQLLLVETTFAEERRRRSLERQRELIEKLQRLSLGEETFLATYKVTLQTHQQELQDMVTADSSSLEALKTRMDGEVRLLERHLAGMKSTHRLEQANLAYNERVLRERLPETLATITHQKRRIAAQHAVLKRLKDRSDTADQKHLKESQKLVQGNDRLAHSIHRHRLDQPRLRVSSARLREEVSQLKRNHFDGLLSHISETEEAVRSILQGGKRTGDVGKDILPRSDWPDEASAAAWQRLEASLSCYMALLKTTTSFMEEHTDGPKSGSREQVYQQ